MKHKKILYFLIFLFFISPLGLLAEYPAWGEWETDFYKKVLGFIPEGMKRNDFSPLIPDYSLNGLNPVLSYYISGIVGITLIFLTFFTLKMFLRRKDER
ncbi:cobalt/nickel transport protein [Persephonella hydrogeniphila]|uniref:Cobalt/nickel transport protein n=1 Tax=Persephonella hydrogeniphila TaxID=198703 RepID=A0A285NC20_9AQUI|nr:PDGLE domain-containing protein [Persephonella hydrogeniphila]SNZ07042.1 cobalt/nickel transport protein [Persephonella hydrogeniphila]